MEAKIGRGDSVIPSLREALERGGERGKILYEKAEGGKCSLLIAKKKKQRSARLGVTGTEEER